MKGKVEALRPDGRLTKGTLIELGQDPELEDAMVVCFWKNGSTTCGWTGACTNGQLIYGSEMMRADVNNTVFPHRHGEADIDY